MLFTREDWGTSEFGVFLILNICYSCVCIFSDLVCLFTLIQFSTNLKHVCHIDLKAVQLIEILSPRDSVITSRLSAKYLLCTEVMLNIMLEFLSLRHFNFCLFASVFLNFIFQVIWVNKDLIDKLQFIKTGSLCRNSNCSKLGEENV